MDFYYENHEGEGIPFFNSQYVLVSHTFNDWNMAYTTTADVSSGFKFEPVEKEFVVRIMPRKTTAAERDEEYRRLIDEFVRIVSADVEKPGKLWAASGKASDYLICRIVGSVKTDWNIARNVTLTCTLLADNPVWMRQVTYPGFISDGGGESTYLDFAYDFSYDYASDQSGEVYIDNNGHMPASWKLQIYGTVTDPTLTLDGKTIAVYTTLSTGDYLTIDSENKTVYTTKNNGTIVNEFNNRYKDESIFDKIEPGMHTISWARTFGFDLIMFEARREPEWT